MDQKPNRPKPHMDRRYRIAVHVTAWVLLLAMMGSIIACVDNLYQYVFESGGDKKLLSGLAFGWLATSIWTAHH